MLGVALIVGLVAGIVEWDIYGWGHTQINRPLVVGLIMGLVLGDPAKGLFIGASIELIYLGTVAVGAAVPPDATSAASIAVALGILSKIDAKVAVTLAVPIATLAQLLQILIWNINSGLMHKADQYVKDADLDKTDRLQYLGAFFFFLQGFIPAFLAILLGVDAVKALVNGMPVWITNWFKVAGGILPALGFAMLYVMMGNKKLTPYFIIGFVISAFFNASLVAVAILGLAAALLYVNKMSEDKIKA